jgi:uncharacterized protein
VSGVGVLAARRVRGALRVDARGLAAHLKLADTARTELLAWTDIDETAATLAIDAGLMLLADAGVTGHDLGAVVLVGAETEMTDAAWILRVALERDDIPVERFADTESALPAAFERARQAGTVLLVAAHGQTATAPPVPVPADLVTDEAAAVAVILGAGGSSPLEGTDAGAAPTRLAARIPADAWRRGGEEEDARLVEPEAAVEIARAWALAADREPRGAYVPPAAFRVHAAARYRFEGQRCTECERLLFPPRERCPDCGSAHLAPHRFAGRGTVFATTRISAGGAPSEFAPQGEAGGPYRVAIVALEEGPRVAAMLTGPGVDGLRIGDAVRFVPRLLYVQEGVARYSFKARRA